MGFRDIIAKLLDDKSNDWSSILDKFSGVQEQVLKLVGGKFADLLQLDKESEGRTRFETAFATIPLKWLGQIQCSLISRHESIAY